MDIPLQVGAGSRRIRVRPAGREQVRGGGGEEAQCFHTQSRWILAFLISLLLRSDLVFKDFM